MKHQARGMILLATWRLAFSLLVWIFTIIMVIMIFRCIKSLILAIKDQGLALLTDSRGSGFPTGRACPVTTLAGQSHHSAIGHHRHHHTFSASHPPGQASHISAIHRPTAAAVAMANADYLPPNTPAPPPYSSLGEEAVPPVGGPEDSPPSYDSLYPSKETTQALAPVSPV